MICIALERLRLALLTLSATSGLLRANETTCPGQIRISGHGLVSLVLATWNLPSQPAGDMQVKSSAEVIPHMNARAYFSEACYSSGSK